MPQRLIVRLDEETIQQLAVIAQADGRTLNNLANWIIKCWIAEYEKK